MFWAYSFTYFEGKTTKEGRGFFKAATEFEARKKISKKEGKKWDSTPYKNVYCYKTKKEMLIKHPLLLNQKNKARTCSQ